MAWIRTVVYYRTSEAAARGATKFIFHHPSWPVEMEWGVWTDPQKWISVKHILKFPSMWKKKWRWSCGALWSFCVWLERPVIVWKKFHAQAWVVCSSLAIMLILTFDLTTIQHFSTSLFTTFTTRTRISWRGTVRRFIHIRLDENLSTFIIVHRVDKINQGVGAWAFTPSIVEITLTARSVSTSWRGRFSSGY